jgi:hypothetical protein
VHLLFRLRICPFLSQPGSAFNFQLSRFSGLADRRFFGKPDSCSIKLLTQQFCFPVDLGTFAFGVLALHHRLVICNIAPRPAAPNP